MVDIKFFEMVEYFKYFSTILRVQISIHEEVKRRLKSGNVCYPSVQNLLPSTLLSRHLKINIYSNIILPVVLCGDEIWFLILKEKCRLSLFENGVLRKIFGIKGNEVMEER
jgi:hypothetical protein